MSRRPVIPIAIGVAILIDVLRVFLPSLITIFGSAGSTPAELIGVYALAWFLGAYLVLAGARLVGARIAGLIGALLMVAGRAALQFTDGDRPQLYLASLALVGGLWWLTATAMTDGAALLPGLVWGLAVATGLHAALDTVDLVWRDGPLPVLIVAVELGLFVAALLLPAGGAGRGEPGPAAAFASHPEPGQAVAARAMLAVGPAMLLWGLYTGNPAHAGASAGWPPVEASIVVTAAGFLAIPFARAPRLTGHPVVPAVALLGSAAAFAFGAVTVEGVHGVAVWWAVPAQAVGALALGSCLGWAGTSSTVDRPLRRGMLLATGLLLFMIFAFAYYAAYDLGVPNDYVPILVVAVVAVPALTGTRRSAPVLDAVGVRRPVLRAVAAAAVAVLATLAIPLWRPSAQAPVPPTEGLRIAAYNIRMGFGLAGTMTVSRQADVLRGLGAQVIVLGEVDRAWFLNGGHDDLRLIAESLGMRAIWAPAADEVWGDALLTSLPVTSVRNHVLVRGGPTGAQALEVGLRWNGRDITVIATHLQPPKDWRPLDQVQQLAGIVRAAPAPTVLAGDLNIEPDSPAWRVLLDAGLTDAFAAHRPFVTSPSPSAPEQIDHILTTPGFRYADAANPDVPWSDHRPVAVTLIPTA